VPFFLGIDGGGTKTRSVLGDENTVLATGSGSGCSVLRVGEACVRDSLACAIHEACVQGGVSPRQIACTCAGVTGAGDDDVAGAVQRLLSEIVGGAVEVVGDMEVALESAFGDGPGVVVVAGTGSISYGRNAKAEIARAGGWGRMISDEGSGHWIGVEALRTSLRAKDAGEDPTLLCGLMDALGASSVHDLAVRVNANPAQDFALLFPVVLSAADEGDPIAIDLLDRSGRELAVPVAAVARKLFPGGEEVAIATHGGVFASSARVAASFKQTLPGLCPQACFVDAVVNPALGALQRARRQFGSVNQQSSR
jgi:N-acetylglucosamine kinase-like BadF-type ATPase